MLHFLHFVLPLAGTRPVLSSSLCIMPRVSHHYLLYDGTSFCPAPFPPPPLPFLLVIRRGRQATSSLIELITSQHVVMYGCLIWFDDFFLSFFLSLSSPSSPSLIGSIWETVRWPSHPPHPLSLFLSPHDDSFTLHDRIQQFIESLLHDKYTVWITHH